MNSLNSIELSFLSTVPNFFRAGLVRAPESLVYQNPVFISIFSSSGEQLSQQKFNGVLRFQAIDTPAINVLATNKLTIRTIEPIAVSEIFGVSGTNPPHPLETSLRASEPLAVDANTSSSGNLSKAASTSSLTFSTVTYADGDGPKSIQTADLNGDGWLDLTVCDRYSNQAAVLLNQGNGTFAPPSYFNIGKEPLAITVADFDGDSDLDLATANSRDRSVSILLNNGSGSFGVASNLVVNNGAHGIVATDLNGDNVADLAVSFVNNVNPSQNLVAIFINNGSGGFSQSGSIAVAGGPWDVNAYDLDSDGDKDLVTANSNSNNLSILINNGSGSFQFLSNLPVGTYPYGVKAADLNGDGILDLAVANARSNNVSVLLGLGNATYAPAVNYTAGAGAKNVAFADFNGDGRLDIAVANATNNNLSILLNNGSGQFSSPINFAAGTGPNSIVTGYFNGDRKVDVAIANGDSDNISVFIQCNNLASITGTAAASVTEDASNSTLTASGSLSVSDADPGENQFSTNVTSTAGSLGSLSITAAGAFSYSVANSAVQYLGAAQTQTDIFTVQSLDGSAAQAITITLMGVNDPASIGGMATASVTEDATNPTLTASGVLTVSDVDQGESQFSTTITSTAGNLGSLSITADGTFNYSVANSAVQYLGAEQTKTDTFTVRSLDGTAAQTITITLIGVNDPASISGTAALTLIEDASNPTLTASGSLAVSDVDQGESQFSTNVTSTEGNLGSLSITADGTFSYSVDNSAVQALGGQSQTDIFTVESLDGTAAQAITITLVGGTNQNHSASISGTATASVTEDESDPTLTASGSLTVSDADPGEDQFNTDVTSTAGNLGSLSITADGTFNYSVDNSAVQYLGAEQTQTDIFTVRSLDGSATQAITITLVGVNDPASISGTAALTLIEDASNPYNAPQN
jgi:VCBS repeat-containing protein